jgi:hypothetical protein
MLDERRYSSEELMYQTSKDIHYTVSPLVLSAAKTVDNPLWRHFLQLFGEKDRHDGLSLAWPSADPQQGAAFGLR